MKIKPEKKVIIEQNKRFSESYLWQLQRDYFDQEGINAWVNQVPFYVTSNPFIANVYARLVIHFVRDWIAKHPEAKQHPFYILELGTGSGQFSFYVLKKLHELRKELGLEDVTIRYIMSDFTAHNIEYWDKHPALQVYLQNKQLDFAIYNLEADEPITLVKENRQLSQEQFVNPLSVFANYIFDTVSHDIFSVSHGRLQEVLVSLVTDPENMQNDKPRDWEKVTIEYQPVEMRKEYYPDDEFNTVVHEYQHTLNETNFLYPIGALRAIKKLRRLTKDKLFLISSDKGYSTLDTLDRLGYPTLAFHGSFSMMVNFHAIARYFELIGGDAFLQTNRKGIKTSVFSCGFNLKALTDTSHAVNEWVEELSPADYFILHRRISETYQECNVETLASHLALTGWDPYIFHKLNTRICSQADEADGATIAYLAANMPKIAANYYYMPKGDNTLFEIAVFYHTTRHYKEAVDYYLRSETYCTEGKFGLFYNVALCQYHLGDLTGALTNFKKALELDAESKETSEWISFLETSLNPAAKKDEDK